MYIDLACHNVDMTAEEAQQFVFLAAQRHLGGISLLPFFIPQIQEYVPEGMAIACPVDYPYGHSDTKVRNHEVLSAIRHGCNTIDLVINTHLAINKEFKKLSSDILSHVSICKDNNVTLRIMLDYRLLPSELWKKCMSILQTAGIEYIFPSTGHLVDDYLDNLVVSVNTQDKFGINAITNGNLFRPDQFKTIKKSKVFGIRFNSLSILEAILKTPLGV